MATKFVAVTRNAAIVAGGGAGTPIADPLLREVVGGVEQAVAPHIVIAVPKIAANPLAVLSPMATGALLMDTIGGGGGANSADILCWRLHPVLLGDAVNEHYANVQNAVAVANGGGGTDYNPLLRLGGVLQAPDIAIPIPKAVQALVTTQSFVPTAMAVGNINFQHVEAAPVAHDILMLQSHTMQRVIAALFGNGMDRRRYFTILDTADAGIGSIYADAADATRLYRVLIAKVSGDGSLLLTTEQIGGTTTTAAAVHPAAPTAGNLNRVSGTGDAVNAFTNVRWEKYVDVQNGITLPFGGGAAGNDVYPNLVENGVPVNPDIVIPVPKGAGVGAVPFVTTNLAGAVGAVRILHSIAAANLVCDVLSIRIHSAFR